MQPNAERVFLDESSRAALGPWKWRAYKSFRKMFSLLLECYGQRIDSVKIDTVTNKYPPGITQATAMPICLHWPRLYLKPA